MQSNLSKLQTYINSSRTKYHQISSIIRKHHPLPKHPPVSPNLSFKKTTINYSLHFTLKTTNKQSRSCPSQQFYYILMSRYQNYREGEASGTGLAKTSRFFSVEPARGFTGNTWDAKHMSNFLSRSNYSNWRGEERNISNLSENTHKRSYSTTPGDHFFKTTKDNRNQSKIGCTPIFPLVSIAPLSQAKQISVREFFDSAVKESRQERVISGRPLKLRCNPEDSFKFQGNAVKFQQTDPLTLRHQRKPSETITGFHKERMSRLIDRRHPHGMTGIDHPENPNSSFYSLYEEKTRIRQQPNTHRTFLIDRDWKQKKRSVPPVDEWKHRKTTTIRKFRNENVHGYNILNNRLLE